MTRIGIFAGTFDPVHAGHIRFALKAAKTAKLDKVVFLPERRPRHKPGVEHFGHRTAMIARAIRPHSKLALLELPDINFNVAKTLPKLRNEFPAAKLVMLMGSDDDAGLAGWPDSEKLLSTCELAIGRRHGDRAGEILSQLPQLVQPVHVIETNAAEISSSRIRDALRLGKQATGLLSSVYRYARSQWLYTSVDKFQKSI